VSLPFPGQAHDEHHWNKTARYILNRANPHPYPAEAIPFLIRLVSFLCMENVEDKGAIRSVLMKNISGLDMTEGTATLVFDLWVICAREGWDLGGVFGGMILNRNYLSMADRARGFFLREPIKNADDMFEYLRFMELWSVSVRMSRRCADRSLLDVFSLPPIPYVPPDVRDLDVCARPRNEERARSLESFESALRRKNTIAVSLLKDENIPNVFAAGEWILRALLSNSSDVTSDAHVYVYGPSVKKTVDRLCTAMGEMLEIHDYKVIQKGSSLFISTAGCPTHLLRITWLPECESMVEALKAMDDCCLRCAYDGKTLYGTPGFVRSLINMTVWDPCGAAVDAYSWITDVGFSIGRFEEGSPMRRLLEESARQQTPRQDEKAQGSGDDAWLAEMLDSCDCKERYGSACFPLVFTPASFRALLSKGTEREDAVYFVFYAGSMLRIAACCAVDRQLYRDGVAHVPLRDLSDVIHNLSVERPDSGRHDRCMTARLRYGGLPAVIRAAFRCCIAPGGISSRMPLRLDRREYGREIANILDMESLLRTAVKNRGVAYEEQESADQRMDSTSVGLTIAVEPTTPVVDFVTGRRIPPDEWKLGHDSYRYVDVELEIQQSTSVEVVEGRDQPQIYPRYGRRYSWTPAAKKITLYPQSYKHNRNAGPF
jgi:hypothetical protein